MLPQTSLRGALAGVGEHSQEVLSRHKRHYAA
jgi:hypothetical protein